ncbi:MAG: CapA family protein [Blastocatellia bacterium]
MKSEKVKFLVGIILGVIVILIAFNYQSIYQYLFTKEIAKIPEKTPTPTIEYKETKVTFLAVGDMMMSRGVNSVIARTNDPLRPFSSLAELLDSTDFNFGNLESPISGSDKPGPPHSLVFNTPIRNVEGLKRYNFKVLNLANNHALDQRAAGLENTRKVLTENEITYLGVGSDLTEAWQPKIITVNGLKLGFLGASYASVNDGGVARNNLVARIEDTEYLKNSLESLKKEADFIVVTMHAGVEYMRQPHQPQIDFARAAIDYGADLVIGAHPHWIQTIEKYKDKYIFYSLGNFIFDQEWSQDTKEGLVLKVSLEGQIAINPSSNTPKLKEKAKLKEIELIPVIIENYSTPRPAKIEEKTKILAKIGLTDAILTADKELPEVAKKK